MIRKNSRRCPICGCALKYYDTVMRILKKGNGASKKIYIHRYKCILCGGVHRELPDNVYPYKQYDSDIIDGVIEGYITLDTIGYDNYPCELTMARWRRACIGLR